MRTPTASPSKLPGHYWAYFFYSVVLGLPLGATVAYVTLAQSTALHALAGLPVAHELRATNAAAAYAGTLAGPAGRVTPTGRPAAMWSSWVTVARRSGKSTTTTTSCWRNDTSGLALTLATQTVPVDPALFARSTFSPDADPWRLMLLSAHVYPIVQTASVFEARAVPAAVLASCTDAPSNRAEGTWRYHEAWVDPGARVEIAGCAQGSVVTACPEGVAAGHLASPHSVRDLARSVAVRSIVSAALLALLVSFFALVALVGALVALRNSARRGPR